MYYHYLECPAAGRPHRRVRRGRGVGGGCGVCKTRTSDILGQFSDLPRSGAGRGGGRPLAQPDAGGVHGRGLLPPDLLGQTAVDGLLVVQVSLNNLRYIKILHNCGKEISEVISPPLDKIRL